MGAVRSRLRRWHVWLGWFVGFRCCYGRDRVVMVARPIEEVRGEHLMAEPRPMRLADAPVPLVAGRRASIADDGAARGRPTVGDTFPTADAPRRSRERALLPPLSAADAAREVLARYSGTAKVARRHRDDRGQPAARTAPSNRRLEGGDGRRYPFLRRCVLGRGGCQAHRLVALLRFDVGLHIMDWKPARTHITRWWSALAILARHDERTGARPDCR